MNADALIAGLALGPARVGALVEGLDPDALRWRPGPGKWSVLEVLGHLVDEERRDFRVRLEAVLRDPAEEWPPIDPEAWVVEHDCQGKEPGAQLEAFTDERARSVRWLRGLEAPDWDRTHAHPRLGDLSAADLLCSWAAHDLLHLRQMNGLLYSRVCHEGAPGSPEYAGSWSTP